MNGRYVVMGVSGCGKSTIGAGIAKALALEFVDGDSLHPSGNIDRMARGEPLSDDDRTPWLEKVGARLAEPGVVIACSALKRRYRDLIRSKAGGPVTFVYLRGERETLIRRMVSRPDHFMPASLLDSQLATLEEPDGDESAITVDIETEPRTLVATLIEHVEAERTARRPAVSRARA